LFTPSDLFGNPVSYDPDALASCTQLLSVEQERIQGMADYDANNFQYLGGKYAIVYMLDKSRHLKTTDPRDKIYALRGLVQGRDILEFEAVVDYSLSVEHVYRNLAKYELIHRKNLNILSSASAINNLTLPSWVPDWTYVSQERRPLGSKAEIQSFLESGGLNHCDPVIRLSADERALYVQGILLVKPKLSGSIHRSPASNDDVHSVFYAKSTFISQTYQIACEAQDPYANGNPKIEEHLRALVYDYIEWQTRLSDSKGVNCADAVQVLAKYKVLDDVSFTKPTLGAKGFESHMEDKRRFCLMNNGYFGYAAQAIELMIVWPYSKALKSCLC
jgi:hypothetical protein